MSQFSQPTVCFERILPRCVYNCCIEIPATLTATVTHDSAWRLKTCDCTGVNNEQRGTYPNCFLHTVTGGFLGVTPRGLALLTMSHGDDFPLAFS